MKPILFPKGSTVFTTEGLGRLNDAFNGRVHEEKNGAFEAQFDIPVSARHFSEIEAGGIFLAKPSPTRAIEPFEIYAIEKSSDGMTATVYGEHIHYMLSRIPVMPFQAGGANAALQGLKTNSVETNPFTFYTDIARSGTYKQTIPSNCLSRLLGEEGSVLQTFRGTYLWEGFNVSLLESRGVNRGVSIRYGKNIVSISQEINIQNTINGICPFWSRTESNGDVTLVTLPEKVIYSDNADLFPFKRTAVLDLSSEWQDAPTETQLRDYTVAYIARNKIGVPHVSFEVEPVALAQSGEYADIGLLERVDLCDTVEVYFPAFDISTDAEVVTTDFDFIVERYISYKVGDAVTTLAQTIAGTEQAITQSEIRQISYFQQAIAQATAIINGDISGSRMITLTDADGNPQGLIFMDTDDPATARNCIRINTKGIGFSNNGPSGPYASAWTIDNTFNAALVNVINLVAKVVQAYNDQQTQLLEIMSGYLDLRSLDGTTWRQRLGAFLATGDQGALRLSSGVVDANGNPTTGQASKRAFYTPELVILGVTEDGAVSGTDADNDETTVVGKAVMRDLTAYRYIKGEQGNFNYINASTIGTELAANDLTTVGATWNFSINGVRFICIEGRTGRLENQSVIIPVATIGSTDTTFGWTDTTGTTSFGVKRSGTTCAVTLTAIPAGGRLLDAYSVL